MILLLNTVFIKFKYQLNIKIQNNVFSRDGPVATSLRSWALNAISAKAAPGCRSPGSRT